MAHINVLDLTPYHFHYAAILSLNCNKFSTNERDRVHPTMCVSLRSCCQHSELDSRQSIYPAKQSVTILLQMQMTSTYSF